MGVLREALKGASKKTAVRETGGLVVGGPGRVAKAHERPGLAEEIAKRAAAETCPVCAERRAKEAARAKRYRAKLRGKQGN